jgi:hypothetical protein
MIFLCPSPDLLPPKGMSLSPRLRAKIRVLHQSEISGAQKIMQNQTRPHAGVPIDCGVHTGNKHTSKQTQKCTLSHLSGTLSTTQPSSATLQWPVSIDVEDLYLILEGQGFEDVLRFERNAANNLLQVHLSLSPGVYEVG